MHFKRTVQTVNLFGTEIPEPRLFLDFLGFEKHVVQIRQKRGTGIWPGWYDHATYYIIDLPAEKFFGSGEEVAFPPVTKAPDYEFEIACVIASHEPALITTPEQGLKFFKEHCYLTIVNDWSCRDIQKKDMEGLGPANSKFITGKSFGPKLVRASEFKMDDNGVLDMKMTLNLNGQERCSSNYNSLYHTHPESGEKRAWSFPRIMSWLGQQNISMQPGYILGSGTIGNGCIAEFTARVNAQTGEVLEPAVHPWLHDGDVVVMFAEGIGTLENKVKIKQTANVK